MNPGAPADHVTPYDRMALSEAALIAALAAPERHEGLVEYFGEKLHADLVTLARATPAPVTGPRRRVYLLPGIMGSQLGFVRGGQRPDDILWLDPIDINFGRLTELRFPGSPRLVALGAMSYTYLKLTLSLRKAGYDTVLVGYDWRQEVAAVGRALAERIAAEGQDRVALVGHSMGGLVARAALAQPGGRHVSQLVMLGTPNHGSVGAVQALRGTYSVVRKLAMLDLRHDAEYLAREVFSSFPGVHELLPSGKRAGTDLFDPASWPRQGPGPSAALLRAAAGLPERLAPADQRFAVVVGCNRITATRVALRDGDFEYEYSLRGDGTVPIDLARLEGARHLYVDCDHSDMPLSDRVIAGTLELLESGRTRRFASSARIRRHVRRRVRDEDLRRQYQGKVDWPHMSPEERRLFLDNLNEPPHGMDFGRTRARKPKARAKRKVRGTRVGRKRAARKR